MKTLMKFLRLSGLVLLIVLASFGIGLTGAIPVPPTRKTEDPLETNIEMVDSKDSATEEKGIT